MLRPRKKLSKKEIKEDALVTYYFKVQKLYQAYRKPVQYSLLGLVVVIVVGSLMVRSKKAEEISAAEKLGIAEQLVYTADPEQSVNTLNDIIETYPGAKATGNAVFLLANIYFQKGDIDQAERHFRLCYEKYSKKGCIASSSLAGVAACLEAKKEYGEAAYYYEKAGQVPGSRFDSPFHLKNAARCYVDSGKKEKGKAIYQQILDQYPESKLNSEIEYLLQAL